MHNDQTAKTDIDALSAIHEEVLELLKNPLPNDIEKRISLIESICRYRHDVRTNDERVK